jgi:hypothetical protein
MKLVLAASFPDSAVLKFSRLIHSFDQQHQGCVIQVISDPALPADLPPTLERLAPCFPVVDPGCFDRDSD